MRRPARSRAMLGLPLMVLGGLTACTEDNPIYNQPLEAGAGGCLSGMRRCDRSTTQVCVPGTGEEWVFSNERVCPSGSTCTEGVCVPSGTICTTDSACGSTGTCAVFVRLGNSAALSTYCAGALGTGAGGQPCKSHSDCRSGLCVGRYSAMICFAACHDNQDCTKPLQCKDLDLTVNGVMDKVKGCTY